MSFVSSEEVMRIAIKSFLLILLVIVLPLRSLSGPDKNARSHSEPGFRIAKGLALDGELWLRGTDLSLKGGAGALISLNLINNSKIVHYQSGVIDIEILKHELWILRQPLPETNKFSVLRWKSDGFQELARFKSSSKNEPVALLNVDGAPAVLCQKTLRLLLGQSRKQRVIALTEPLRWGVQVSVASPISGSTVYVGINRGEWGGGLERVDAQTGRVAHVERRNSKALCSGPLNSECDPVTGVVPDPRNQNCVLAAVGLFHLDVSEGRILRVCGDRVDSIFEKPVTGGFDGKMRMTDSIYGLAAAEGGGIWAVGLRALYHLGADGKEDKEYSIPNLASVSGITLGHVLPGVLVVSTDVNSSVSTSGYTPLVIPLEESQTQAGASQ